MSNRVDSFTDRVLGLLSQMAQVSGDPTPLRLVTQAREAQAEREQALVTKWTDHGRAEAAASPPLADEHER